MIRVTLKNIQDYDLPLENYSKVFPRGMSKKVLEQLEKKYNRKTDQLCRKVGKFNYEIYVNVEYWDISDKDKDSWVVNYEVYIRSSFIYKFWIFVYKIKNKFNI